jgi:hypothetical protein
MLASFFALLLGAIAAFLGGWFGEGAELVERRPRPTA